MFAAIGPGRYRATSAATSSNSVGASERISARIGVGLQLEHPDGVAAGQQVVGRLVVERDVVDVDLDAAGGADQLERVGDDVQVPQAEEVHLQQTQLLDAVHLVLGDDRRLLGVLAGLRLALDRAGSR